MLSWLAGGAFGLTISTFIPRPEVAMAMVPLLIIPFMLFAGFFVNQNNIPYFFYEFAYISIFKYAFQSLAQNEFTDITLNCPNTTMVPVNGTMTQVVNGTIPCTPLATAGYDQGILLSCGLLGVLAVSFRFISYLGLITISSPKKAKIERRVQIKKTSASVMSEPQSAQLAQ